MRIVVAPVPGVIKSVFVRPDERVARGQILLELTLMEMVQKIPSPEDGSVRLVLVRSGEHIGQGGLLVELES